jgi:hypothetical protein
MEKLLESTKTRSTTVILQQLKTRPSTASRIISLPKLDVKGSATPELCLFALNRANTKCLGAVAVAKERGTPAARPGRVGARPTAVRETDHVNQRDPTP